MRPPSLERNVYGADQLERFIASRPPGDDWVATEVLEAAKMTSMKRWGVFHRETATAHYHLARAKAGRGDQPIPAVLGGGDAFSSESALILAAKEGALAPGLADNERWIIPKTLTGWRRSAARPEEKSQAGASTQARGGTGHTSPWVRLTRRTPPGATVENVSTL